MKRYFDPLIFFPILFLNFSSLFFIKGFSSSAFKNQLLFSFLGLAIFFIISRLGHSGFLRFSRYLYLIFFVLLFLTLFSKPISNTKAWLHLGFFNLQPSEWLKPILCLFIAEELRREKNLLKIIFFSFLPVFIIFLQPDFGTSLAFFVIIGIFLFFQRFTFTFLITLLIFIFLSSIFSWFFILKPYQKQRIYTFLFPMYSQSPDAYQAKQSLIAVGSGKFLGRGFSKATQSQLKFLPAQHTDFIFASISERTGFLGSFFHIILYMILIFYSFYIADTAPNREEKILIYLILGYFSFHIIYNMGMVVSIFPITGIPLLFLSYGGSSLTASYFAFSLINSISLRRFGEYEI